MHVAIRTDASALIGSGHVMRCLTLTAGLKRHGHDVTFICRDHDGNLIPHIATSGHNFVVLPAAVPADGDAFCDDYAAWLAVPSSVDAEQTRTAIDQLDSQPDWLIVDHYGISKEWESHLRDSVGRIMVIDDLANRPHDCDLLLDQNYSSHGAVRYAGLVPDDCQQLIGPTYALLREEFAATRTSGRQNIPDNRVNVFFGGVDATGETVKFLDAVIDGGFEDVRFDVVVGARNPRRNRILKLASRHGGVSIHENVPNMAELFSRATIAVGAGGTTTWERCCLGLPQLLIAVAHNQVNISQEIDAAEAAQYLGKSEQVSGDTMASSARDLLRDASRRDAMSRTALEIVDGLGAERVVSALGEKIGVPA